MHHRFMSPPRGQGHNKAVRKSCGNQITTTSASEAVCSSVVDLVMNTRLDVYTTQVANAMHVSFLLLRTEENNIS